MTDTPNLALPYILASQAQKHVTHNEAIRALDCLVQLSVASRVLASPPATPVEGSRYIVAAGAADEWLGQSNKIAAYQDGAWAFYAPKDGWLAWVVSENILVVYEAAGWSALPTGGGGEGGGVTDHGLLTGLADDDHLQYHTDARGDARYMPLDPAMLGINATADTTNRLAVASPASLFNHDGAGHQVKVNKNAATDTASFLFQDGFSGRAEIGLAGDDDFHFKVNSDGSTWHDGIKIDRTTGRVDFPNTGSFPNYRNRVINPCGAVAQAGLAATADGNYTGFDQWLALTQSNAVTPSQLTDVTSGIPTMMRMTQANATAQRMGWMQPFEANAVRDLRNKTVALQFVARMSAATTLRYAIVEWTGAVDSIAKDVVADWTKTTFTAGQFFAASNLTIAATGSMALASDTLTDVSLSADISPSMNNLMIFVWTDTAQAQNVTLDLGNVFFGQGASAPAAFDPPAPDANLRRCRKYIYVIAPAAGQVAIAIGECESATEARTVINYPVPMRAVPTLTVSAPGDLDFRSGGTHLASAISATTAAGSESCTLATTHTGLGAGNAGFLRTANAGTVIMFDARL